MVPALIVQAQRLSASLPLRAQVGPTSAMAAVVMPTLFGAIRDASASTSLDGWRGRFGQVVGVSSRKLDRVVQSWSGSHGCAYEDDVPAWLLALHTWLGVLLRLTAACALPRASEAIADTRIPLRLRMARFESGELFLADGVANLRSGALGWYMRDDVLATIAPQLEQAIALAAGWASSGRGAEAWAGDAFRALYEELVPRDLRHALGEVYTPDSYASHALDVAGWATEESLVDPTCGMGAFLIEAVRRRLARGHEQGVPVSASQALEGLAGFDINPLAVLAARCALTLMLANRFEPRCATTLPVYVADVILLASNTPEAIGAGPEADGEDAVQARQVPRGRCVAGNPPWVKWSQLPPDYARAIRPHCAAVNVFSRDRYVGGIEADMSAVVTHLAAARWLEPGGRLAFYLPAPLFSTEAGEGFRAMRKKDGAVLAGFECVEDLRAVRPFDGVATPAALVVLRKGAPTRFPVPWRLIEADGTKELVASPVPGTDHGPWLRGTAADHASWGSLLDASRPSHYRARKGVTTDCNGVYFVKVLDRDGHLLLVENDPSLGRKEGIEHVRAWVEDTHVYPLMRGRGLSPFHAVVDATHCVLVPQRGMHGDPELERRAPRTYEFLRRFEAVLRARGSYRRYQKGKPFWSTWSTGTYTFEPWKVLWKEMSGARFGAAVAGPATTEHLPQRPVVPDHKLYFVPAASEGEAHYLCGVLNAPTIATVVSSYAAQLSLGVSVVENLTIPGYQPGEATHDRIAELARRAAGGAGVAAELDDLVIGVVSGDRG